MFKKIEILDKEKFKSMKFTNVEAVNVAKETGVMPLGFNEIIEMSHFCPIVIMGSEDSLEFIAFTGVSPNVNIFHSENTYMPMFPQTYPFLNMVVHDEDGEKRNIIGIDNDKDVAKRKKNAIFTKDGELENLPAAKIEQVRELNRQRDISRSIVQEMKDHNLLLEKDFKVKFESEEKTILEKFYIINREKLTTLDDATLALWAKKGWMGIIDCHIKSLTKFQKVLMSIKK